MGSESSPARTSVPSGQSIQQAFPAPFQDGGPPGGHVVTDSRGLIRSADRAAADMMRASRRDLVGQSLSDWLAPEDRAILPSQLRRLEQSECGLEWETTLTPKGLRSVSAWLTVFALREASGHMAAVHWIMRDLSAWKRREGRRPVAPGPGRTRAQRVVAAAHPVVVV